MSMRCPVCEAELDFEPWRGDSASFEICPSCSIQFGYNDARPDIRSSIHSTWREEWLANGRRPFKGERWHEVSKSVVSRVVAQAGPKTITLYRPVGPAELALIRESAWREFPPRLPEQPIFYPVLDVEYATQIARDWNAKRDGGGYVIQFRVRADFIGRYAVQTVGSKMHRELWVPAEDLAEFNRNIVGEIVIIAEFRGDPAADLGRQEPGNRPDRDHA